MNALRLFVCLCVVGCGGIASAKPVLPRAAIIAKIQLKKASNLALGKMSDLDAIVGDVQDYAYTHAPDIAQSHGENLTKAKKLYSKLGSKATPAELDAFAVLMERYRDEARAEAARLKKSITASKNRRYAAELIAETFELYRTVAAKRTGAGK